MSFLLSNCNELSFDGLVAVNGGSSVCSNSYSGTCKTVGVYIPPKPIKPGPEEIGDVCPTDLLLSQDDVPKVLLKSVMGSSDPKGYYVTLKAK